VETPTLSWTTTNSFVDDDQLFRGHHNSYVDDTDSSVETKLLSWTTRPLSWNHRLFRGTTNIFRGPTTLTWILPWSPFITMFNLAGFMRLLPLGILIHIIFTNLVMWKINCKFRPFFRES
jgi:hypothetical protein